MVPTCRESNFLEILLWFLPYYRHYIVPVEISVQLEKKIHLECITLSLKLPALHLILVLYLTKKLFKKACQFVFWHAFINFYLCSSFIVFIPKRKYTIWNNQTPNKIILPTGTLPIIINPIDISKVTVDIMRIFVFFVIPFPST